MMGEHARRRRMRKSHALLLLVLLAVALSVLAQGKPPLRLVHSIPMPGFEGCDFDHFDSDLKGNRLILAAEDHNTVEVFNLRTGKHLHSIMVFAHPHGIVFLPNSNKTIVTHTTLASALPNLLNLTTHTT